MGLDAKAASAEEEDKKAPRWPLPAGCRFRGRLVLFCSPHSLSMAKSSWAMAPTFSSRSAGSSSGSCSGSGTRSGA